MFTYLNHIYLNEIRKMTEMTELTDLQKQALEVVKFLFEPTELPEVVSRIKIILSNLDEIRNLARYIHIELLRLRKTGEHPKGDGCDNYRSTLNDRFFIELPIKSQLEISKLLKETVMNHVMITKRLCIVIE